jgi:hypothetical protein
MRRALLLTLSILAGSTAAAQAAEWRLQKIDTPARVLAIGNDAGTVQINAGGLWYGLALSGEQPALAFIDRPAETEHPDGALPDARIVSGTRDIARAWLADPTTRYAHGVLGDKLEAGSLVIEMRDGTRQAVKLKEDAVFEDLEPRLADLDGDGRDEVVVVKSYLKRGAALAVVAARKGHYEIVAETPPLGSPNRWLDPAGIADFNGDGKTDIALVRQPHVVGMLELWTYADGKLRKTAEMTDTSNHIIGTRAIDMSAVADFDGDGVADLALPSLDRSRLRLIAFTPQPREIAAMKLPAKAVTDFGLVAKAPGGPAVALGRGDG